MKRLRFYILSVLLALISISATAQDKPVYLHTLTPLGGHNYKFAHNMNDYLEMGGLVYKRGFGLSAQKGNFVEWSLKGKYKTLSFILGSEPWYDKSHKKGILVITGDGRKIVDRIITTYESPQWITADITGVDILRFYVPNTDADAGLADVAVWRADQTPYQTSPTHTFTKSEPIMLCRDLMPYRVGNRHTIYSSNPKFIKPDDILAYRAEDGTIRLSGQTYKNGIEANAEMALIGNAEAISHFNLGGQFAKMSFIVGPLDTDDGTLQRGWFVIKSNDKIIYEKEIIEGELASEVTIDIEGCRYLEIRTHNATGSLRIGIANCMLYPKGYEVVSTNQTAQTNLNNLPGNDPTKVIEKTIDTSEYLKSLPDVCKLVTSIPPYAIGGGMTRENAVFEDLSQYVTFSMGGIKYSEGVVLQSTTNFFHNNTGAHVLFNLGGEFDYLSFTTGWVGKCGVLKNDWLRVTADDKVVLQVPLKATDPNRSYTVPLHKCKILKFEKLGMASMDHPAFGLADMVVYRGEPVEHNLFHHPVPECPETIDLIDLNLPYIHYVSSAMDVKRLFDGSTQREYFAMPNGERIYKGFLLKTSVHFDLEMGPTSEPSTGIIAPALGASFMVGAIGGATVSMVAPFGALLALAAGGTAHEASCAAFNTWKEYNYVTFTVACRVKHNTIDTIDCKQDPVEILKIGADGQVVAEFGIYDKMQPTTYTVPINKCQQLMFWLECGGSNSGQFILYDLKVHKNKPQITIPLITERNNVPQVLADKEPYNICSNAAELYPQIEWQRPSTINRTINEYFDLYTERLKKFDDFMEEIFKVQYTTVSRYIKSANGHQYRSISVQEREGDRYNLFKIMERNKTIINTMMDQRSLVTAVRVARVPAMRGLLEITDPKRLVEFREHFKQAAEILKAYEDAAAKLIEAKKAENKAIESLINNSLDIDGIKSTEFEVFVK